MQLVLSTNAKIEEINSTGIIFQHIGQVYLQENIWRVTTKVDLQNYTQELKNLNTYQQYLVDLTESIRNNNNETVITDLRSLIQEFQNLMNSIRDINEIILGGKENVRRKRSAFPAIGSLFHEAIGIADENTINDIYEKITQLSESDREIGYVIKNHTFYTQQLLARTDDNIKELKKEIQTMMDKMKRLARQLDELEIREQILLTAQIMTLVVIRYTKYQNYFLESLMTNEATYIKPELIPFTDLKEILQKIESRIDNTQMVPHRLIDNSGLSMYKLLSMRAYVVKNSIIYIINVPTITRNKKSLYSVHAAPTRVNDTLVYIEPKSQFIVLNKLRNEIGYLSRKNFEVCIKVIQDEYLCPNEFPIYSKLSNQCELEILTNQVNVSNLCKMEELPLQTMFINLYYPHHYYYVTPSPKMMNLECNNTITEVMLNSTGIIMLEPDCTIYDQEISISAPGEIQITHTQEYITSKYRLEKRKTSNYELISEVSDLDQRIKGYEDISQKLNELQDKEDEIVKKPILSNEVDHFTKYFGLITLILILCILSILCYLCKCK